MCTVYSKASIYAAFRCVNLVDTLFEIGSKGTRDLHGYFQIFRKNLEKFENLEDFTQILKGVLGFLPTSWCMTHGFRDTLFFIEPRPRYPRPDCIGKIKFIVPFVNVPFLDCQHGQRWFLSDHISIESVKKVRN